MTVKYTFTEANFKEFYDYAEHGLISEFLVYLQMQYLEDDINASEEQSRELETQFMQTIASMENKSLEEVNKFYTKLDWMPIEQCKIVVNLETMLYR